MSASERIGATRTVTWTVVTKVSIGHVRCGGCNMETPEPTDDVLIKFAKQHQDHRYIWPADWTPPGWSAAGVDDTERYLCPNCTKAVRACLTSQKVAKRPTP